MERSAVAQAQQPTQRALSVLTALRQLWARHCLLPALLLPQLCIYNCPGFLRLRPRETLPYAVSRIPSAGTCSSGYKYCISEGSPYLCFIRRRLRSCNADKRILRRRKRCFDEAVHGVAEAGGCCRSSFFCLLWLILLQIIPLPLLIPSPGGKGQAGGLQQGGDQRRSVWLSAGRGRSLHIVLRWYCSRTQNHPKTHLLPGTGNSDSSFLALPCGYLGWDGCGNCVCQERGGLGSRPPECCVSAGWLRFVIDGPRREA